MALLYFWRGDRYAIDIEELRPGERLFLHQDSPRLRAATPGERLWAFTRRDDGTYALAASLVVEQVDEGANEFGLGRYRVTPRAGSTLLYDVQHGEDLEPLVRRLSVSSSADILGRSFQGGAAVRDLTDADNDSLREFAARQPIRAEHSDVDQDWLSLLAAARKAFAGDVEFQSPRREVRYRIGSIDLDAVEVIRLDARKPARISRGLLSKALERIRSAGGTIQRTGLSATVAEETAIIFLHPRLEWTPDRNSILLGGDFSRSGAERRPQYQDFGEAPNDDPAELQSFARRVRRGQRRFRDSLLRAYGRKCGISGCSATEVLEAAHIDPHWRAGINSLDNGLLLRADLHILFDEHRIRIHPTTLEIHVSEGLRDTEYAMFHGRSLRERDDGGRPSEQYLQTHWNTGSR